MAELHKLNNDMCPSLPAATDTAAQHNNPYPGNSLTDARKAHYTSALQVLFAGFVASARSRDIAPTIRSLWLSDQLHLYLPSLRELHSYAGGNGEDLQQLLLAILIRGDRFVRPSVPVIDGGATPHLDVEWELTPKYCNRIFALPFPSDLTTQEALPPPSPSSRPSIYDRPWWNH